MSKVLVKSGVRDSDLASKRAAFATPATLVHLTEWADKILCE